MVTKHGDFKITGSLNYSHTHEASISSGSLFTIVDEDQSIAVAL